MNQARRGLFVAFSAAALMMPLPMLDVVLAQSSSVNFRMTIDTLNTGGGSSNSTNFAMFGCLAPAPEAGGASTSASFQLTAGCPVISAAGQACGNGIVESPEACDDADTDNGDGCSSTCAVEADWTCTGSPSVCTPNPTKTPTRTGSSTPTVTLTATPTQTATSTPSITATSTGTQTATTTATRTPTSTSTSTATSTPTRTPSATATTTPTRTQTWTPTSAPVCPNGIVEPGEQCDDGNLMNGDCCSNTCVAAPAVTICTDDGDGCTADRCNGSGQCTHTVNVESQDCGNCSDGQDNDSDSLVDCHDPGCSLIAPQFD